MDEGPGNVFDLFPSTGTGGEDKQVFAVAEFFIELQGAKHGVEKFRVAGIGERQLGAQEQSFQALLEGGLA